MTNTNTFKTFIGAFALLIIALLFSQADSSSLQSNLLSSQPSLGITYNQETQSLSINALQDIGTAQEGISGMMFELQYTPSQIHFGNVLAIGPDISFQPTALSISTNNNQGIAKFTLAYIDDNDQGFTITQGTEIFSFPLTIQDHENTAAIQFQNVQVIDTQYNIRSMATQNFNLTPTQSENNTLEILSALYKEETNSVDIYFNDFIQADSITSISAQLHGTQSMTLSAATRNIDGKSLSFILPSQPSQQDDFQYITITGNIQGNSKNGLKTEENIVYISFNNESEGFGITEVISANKNLIIFQGENLPANNLLSNPTRYNVKSSNGQTMRIQSVRKTEGNRIEMKLTDSLTENTKYSLILKEFPSISDKQIQYFFVETAAKTQAETANHIGTSIIFEGQDMNNIIAVTIQGNKYTNIQKSNTMISLDAPAELSRGIYDVIFHLANNTQQVKQNFLSYKLETINQINVLSDQSKASPRVVPNDGETTTRLWIATNHSNNLHDIQKVTLNLSSLDQSVSQLAKSVNEDGDLIIENSIRWFYLDVTVPRSVQVSPTPYSIPVIAEDVHGNIAEGSVELTINNNRIQSSTPEILDIKFTPTQIQRGGKMGIHVYVKDLDGTADIESVLVDLTEIGMSPRTLTPLLNTPTGDTSAQESQFQWYGIEDITVPSTTRLGTYNITVHAYDKGGQDGIGEKELQVTQGHAVEFDTARDSVFPRDHIPNNGIETFSLQVFVKDLDGIEDVTSVYADLRNINGSSVELTREGSIKTGQESAFYSVHDLTIPAGTSLGNAMIYVIANDSQGNEAETDIQIQVTDEDEVGDSPEINSARSYTVPAVIQSDSSEEISLNIFVENNDFPIDQVMVDLSNIAEFTGNFSDIYKTTTCEGASSRMLCMVPGLKEGSAGQWFYLPHIKILSNVSSSMESYRISVSAIDSKGKSGSGYISLHVGDGELPTDNLGFPKITMAISTADNKVEVVFSDPLDPEKVKIGGFKISYSNNRRRNIAITDVTLNATATVATLTTSEQSPDEFYTLYADAKKLGLKSDKFTDNNAEFIGFEKREIPPQIAKITAKSAQMIEVVFSEGLRPSTVKSNGRDFEIFTHEKEPKRLKVKHVEFVDDNMTIRISTENQISDQRYILRVKKVESAAGIPVGGKDRSAKNDMYFGTFKHFKAFKQSALIQQKVIGNNADFNNDGKIDFTDFTIFSSVYGQTISTQNNTTNTRTHTTTPLDGTVQPSTSSISN